MNHDTESSRVDTTSSSTLVRFHGQPCVYSSFTFQLEISLSFDQWSSREAHTKQPYTLTLTSNECITFIAALSQSKLLVTSKHSLGPVQGVTESHVQVGERWLHRHLEQAGKTSEQLAETLYAKHWTAVAEVCHPTRPNRAI